MGGRRTVLIACLLAPQDNFEASWLYIRSFGHHYDQMLNSFANGCAHPMWVRDSIVGPIHKKRLAGLEVIESRGPPPSLHHITSHPITYR